MMTRQQAIERGASRYFGKVCDKHSELNGERAASNGGCVACNKNWRHEYKIKREKLTLTIQESEKQRIEALIVRKYRGDRAAYQAAVNDWNLHAMSAAKERMMTKERAAKRELKK